MILLLRHFIGWMVGVFGSREDLILETSVITSKAANGYRFKTGQRK